MPNLHRGEISARLDGAPYRLCLTLGALADLESAFGDDDMLALAERFASGRIAARDAIRIIAAGLRGAGHDLSDEAVARMHCDGGAAGFIDILARLLAATFGGPASAQSEQSSPHSARSVSPLPTVSSAHTAPSAPAPTAAPDRTKTPAAVSAASRPDARSHAVTEALPDPIPHLTPIPPSASDPPRGRREAVAPTPFRGTT